jgi:hypothetical protein
MYCAGDGPYCREECIFELCSEYKGTLGQIGTQFMQVSGQPTCFSFMHSQKVARGYRTTAVDKIKRVSTGEMLQWKEI